jgi:GNAT superfamily N-acetyltransferase
VSEPPAGIQVVAVGPEVGRPLRMAVLRPHQAAEVPMYPLEDDPGTLHLAAIGEDGGVLAVGSLMREPHPREPRPGDWRVRGMATLPALRGLGLGSAVLAACETRAAGAGGKRLWCNARVGARGFYERAGLSVEGAVFEIAGIGPHVLMSKQLA